MKVHTVKYDKKNGWSSDKFPELDSDNTLIIIFGASAYFDDPKPIQFIAKKYPKSKIVGCSTSGEIYQNEIFDESLSVAIIKFDKSTFKITSENIQDSRDVEALGERLGLSLYDADLKSVLVLSDGLSVNGTGLIKGLNKVLPDNVYISGGLAGDGDQFSRTWVIHENQPKTDRVLAVGFIGKDLEFGFGTRGGWEAFGPERKITKSSGNVLLEIDNKPALELYKQYLGEKAKELPSSALLFPLAIREHPGSEKKLVRTILSVDEETQSMTFAGDIPQGWTGQLCQAKMSNLIEGAWSAGENASSMLKSPKDDVMCIAISCVGRRLVMGEQTEDEVDATLDALPKNTQQIGFYSYGEISPSGFESCNLHNQTMTLTTLFEK